MMVDELASALDGAYRERAELVSALTMLFPSVMAYNDVTAPEWPVVYLTTGVGQLSWHISQGDLDLFTHIEVVDNDDSRARWDGHTTEEKYQRLKYAMASIDVS